MLVLYKSKIKIKEINDLSMKEKLNRSVLISLYCEQLKLGLELV